MRWVNEVSEWGEWVNEVGELNEVGEWMRSVSWIMWMNEWGGLESKLKYEDKLNYIYQLIGLDNIINFKLLHGANYTTWLKLPKLSTQSHKPDKAYWLLWKTLDISVTHYYENMGSFHVLSDSGLPDLHLISGTIQVKVTSQVCGWYLCGWRWSRFADEKHAWSFHGFYLIIWDK